MSPDEPTMALVAPCLRCGHPFMSDPFTVPSVWVDDETLSSLRPDGTDIVPGAPGTHREPLCDACAAIHKAAQGKRLPLLYLFPRANVAAFRLSAN